MKNYEIIYWKCKIEQTSYYLKDFYHIYADAITKETEFENDNYKTVKLTESEYMKYF